MQVEGNNGAYRDVEVQALAIAVFKDESPDSEFLKALDSVAAGMVRSAIETEELKGKEGDLAYFHLLSANGAKARRLLLVGVGERDQYKDPEISRMAGTAARFLRGKAVKSIAIVPRAEGDSAAITSTAIQGAIIGLFEPDKYRTVEKEERQIEQLVVVIDGADADDLKRGTQRGRIIGESVNFTRDLANEPGAYMTPTIMADRARHVAAEFGLSIDVLDEARMEQEGMGSLLSVSHGRRAGTANRVEIYSRECTSILRQVTRLCRQGCHIRLGRHIAEAGREYGVDEVRHDRRGHRDWCPARDRPTQTLDTGAWRRALYRESTLRESNQAWRRGTRDDRQNNRGYKY